MQFIIIIHYIGSELICSIKARASDLVILSSALFNKIDFYSPGISLLQNVSKNELRTFINKTCEIHDVFRSNILIFKTHSGRNNSKHDKRKVVELF